MHRRLTGKSDIAQRMQKIATRWQGRPYIPDSLIGGPDLQEKLVVNLRAFDCVTFVESVLALARSRSTRGFLGELKSIRYRGGQIDWFSRLHYFSDWMKSNHARGTVRIRTRGAGSRSIEARLSLLDDLPPRRCRFHVVPKRKLHQARRRIENGSVIGFASVRSRLDFFHTGLLFIQDDQLLLFHASRSAKKVVAEPLAGFLQRNRMRGIAFAAPRDAGESR